MKIKTHSFVKRTEHREPWIQLWHGLYANKNYGHWGPSVPKMGSEHYLEASCVLSALENVESPRVMELGAGWGRQTLTVAGTKGKGTFYAVEAEPNHFQWLQNTLLYNNIEATTIFGAMTASCGWTKIKALGRSPEDWYGQSVNEGGNLKVPKYNLDYLFKTFNVGELDLLHMDVQEQEVNVLAGGQGRIKDVKIIIIGIHAKINPDDLIKLAPKHRCLLCLPRKSGKHQVPNFGEVNMLGDGLLVLERK